MGVYLINRKGIWYVREKVNGKIVYSKSTGEESKVKAKKHKDEYLLGKREVKIKPAERVLCSTLQKEYLELYEPPAAPKKTYGAISCAFNEFIRIAGDKYVDEYSEKDIDTFLKRKIKETSRQTAHRIRRTLRPAFKLAIRWKYTTTNPWVGSIEISLPESDPNFITVEEYKWLLQYCNPVFADVVTWFVLSGLRQAELIKLRPSHIFPEKRLIKIYSFDANPTKDKETRSVEMHSKLVQIYDRYKHQEFLFINPNSGKQYTPKALIANMTEACKRAGLVHYTIQDLRSTYGMWLLNNDAPLKWISQQMGHSSVLVTERFYAKYITNEFKGEIDKINF